MYSGLFVLQYCFLNVAEPKLYDIIAASNAALPVDDGLSINFLLLSSCPAPT